ncbi:MAG: hypothetical protein M3O34_09740 [Chloroflexota bacterium]|nr:hypothetical protein [Chloroflexota bacterium]
MHWELWTVDTANLVGTFDTEAEGLALVRELVGKGWPAEALSLPVEALARAVSGTELVRRAEASQGGVARPDPSDAGVAAGHVTNQDGGERGGGCPP